MGSVGGSGLSPKRSPGSSTRFGWADVLVDREKGGCSRKPSEATAGLFPSSAQVSRLQGER